MKRTPATVTGFVLCVLLGLLDVVAVLGAGVDDPPPLAVIIAGGLLGIATVAAALPAWRGNRVALLLVVASRAASVLLSVPAFFTESAGTLVAVTVLLVVSVVAIALLAPAARRDRVVRPS